MRCARREVLVEVRPFNWKAPVPGASRTRATASLRRPVAVLRHLGPPSSALGPSSSWPRRPSGWSPASRSCASWCSSRWSAWPWTWTSWTSRWSAWPAGSRSTASPPRAWRSNASRPAPSAPLGLGLLGLGADGSRPMAGPRRVSEGFGLLGLVTVVGVGVDAELARHLPAEPVVREHALDGPSRPRRRPLRQEPVVTGLGEPTRVPRVPVRRSSAPCPESTGSPWRSRRSRGRRCPCRGVDRLVLAS